jgi:hypothetical protein
MILCSADLMLSSVLSSGIHIQSFSHIPYHMSDVTSPISSMTCRFRSHVIKVHSDSQFHDLRIDIHQMNCQITCPICAFRIAVDRKLQQIGSILTSVLFRLLSREMPTISLIVSLISEARGDRVTQICFSLPLQAANS